MRWDILTKTQSHVAQTGLQLTVDEDGLKVWTFLPLPPKGWDYKQVVSYPASDIHFLKKTTLNRCSFLIFLKGSLKVSLIICLARVHSLPCWCGSCRWHQLCLGSLVEIMHK